ncbi:hypothetical protein R1flu_000028 [Riccia fluitans]|uniref:Uncharacterized protein n=1 Tax=Riccia fluitans TaxID=41844 RepID=A0ABD1XZ94_9MARC
MPFGINFRGLAESCKFFEDVEVESRNFKIRSVGCGVLLETLFSRENKVTVEIQYLRSISEGQVEKLKELTAALNRTSENTEKQIAKIR